jgi:hypothetical protein
MSTKLFKTVIFEILEAAGQKELFERALANDDTAHIKVKNDGWMPLTIEAIGNSGVSNLPMISVCHYGEQNGDAMRDPEMVFEILSCGTWVASSFQNDYMGYCRELIKTRKEDGTPLSGVVDSFPAMWARNLREQGFVKAAKAKAAHNAV